MAQMSEIVWEPPEDNPLPRADTTATFVAHPRENPDGGVRVTYTLSHPNVQFVLPSPPADGGVVVLHKPNRLVEDYPAIRTDPTSIERALTLDASGRPARLTLVASVADVVDGSPVRERTRRKAITFRL